MKVDGSCEIFSLRRNVSKKKDFVWQHRDYEDVYTGVAKQQTAAQTANVDHVLEIQIVEHAMVGTIKGNREMIDRVRDALNSVENLNVTTKRINMAKKGPFTAALNRLNKRDGTLREISVDQLARSGKAKWLVDEGVWDKIKRNVIVSYDELEDTLTQSRLTRIQSKTLEHGLDDLHSILNKMHLF